MVVIYILHFVSIHITRAICIEETNSLEQILCSNIFLKRLSFFHKFALKAHYTLIINKMLVAFAFRPLAVFVHALLYKK